MLLTLTISTSKQRELVDITDQIEKTVYQFKLKEGMVLIFTKHTTCCLIISETEDNLENDLIESLKKLAPKGPFKHSHSDLIAHDPKHAGQSHTPAHILSSIIGQQVLVPIVDGKLLLGIWQRICLLELYGPRTRKVIVRISQ